MIYLGLINQFLNCKDKQGFEQYQIKLGHLSKINSIYHKNLRIFEESNSERVNNLFINRIHLILKRFKPIVLNPQQIYTQKFCKRNINEPILITNKILISRFVYQYNNLQEKGIEGQILQSFASRYLKEKKLNQVHLSNAYIIVIRDLIFSFLFDIYFDQRLTRQKIICSRISKIKKTLFCRTCQNNQRFQLCCRCNYKYI
ncbi:unnamed protein product [Paramecium primaurelia]|uniref:Uncharacterized protein n=1 Tax=Paramecium primaurelia TaxID=5886 RepID=A0A8S1L3I0_PARPR|nr:unnamed protein product [Paramecium primaurelia]